MGRVDELGIAHGISLQRSFQVAERAHSLPVVLVVPAFGDGIDRLGVEVVQLLPTTPHRGQQVRRLQHRASRLHANGVHGERADLDGSVNGEM
ncbi:hypothetical protein HF519_23635 [Pseudonocardia bannensis]|uniref:Uncharacterized protein n=1 Tax=Pseudonocardia bannensis TaxID=630973 RepID=A0A848DQC6_9PSEU|nr:hypothetical protein [Pseudonocardia bannensis]